MAVTNRNSALYLSAHVNKYLQDTRDFRGGLLPIPFKHTVVSGEVGGASALARDTVNLCVIPALHEVVALSFSAENLFASAAANGTFQIGDSGDDDRYMVAMEMYTAAGSPIPAEVASKPHGLLAFAGMLYRPTVDTIVLGEWRVANPTVGKTLKGCFFVIPPMN